MVPPHLREALHGGSEPDFGAASAASSGAGRGFLEAEQGPAGALARAGAAAEAAGAEAAAAAARRALSTAPGAGPGDQAAWVAEMLEAQRPSINAAHERGVPVRVSRLVVIPGVVGKGVL